MKPTRSILRIPGWLGLLTLALVFAAPAGAASLWTGRFFIDGTRVTNPETESNLLKSGVVLSVTPPVKYGLNFRINARLDYAYANGEDVLNFLPLGFLSMDLSKETWSASLQHQRSITITTAAQLVENLSSRLAFNYFARNGLRLQTSLSRLETDADGRGTSVRDQFFLFANYPWRWFTFRSGYNQQVRRSDGGQSITSKNLQFGVALNAQILPRTSLVGDIDLNRFASDTTSGFETNTARQALRLGLNSRPLRWFGVDANYSRDNTDFDSQAVEDGTNFSRFVNATATLYPAPALRFWTTLGNRLFDDQFTRRDIDFWTLASSWNPRVTRTIRFDFLLSRTIETDPLQGDNIRTAFVSNSTFELVPLTTLRWNLNITRNEVPSFQTTESPDAAGPLTDRVLYDAEPAGFTFLDTDNLDLYTKNSATIADWSAPVRIEPTVTEPYFVNRNVQLRSTLTRKLSLVLFYGATSSSEQLELTRIEGYNVRGTLAYRPNRRTGYTLTSTSSHPEFTDASRTTILTFTYSSLRGHRLNLNFGGREFADDVDYTFSGNLRLDLRRRNALEITYSSARFLSDLQSDFLRVRYTRSFK